LDPWDGAVVLSLSPTHGVRIGDLPALLLLVAVAVVIGHAATRHTRLGARSRAAHWAGPASAVLVGLLLVLALVNTTTKPTLLPAGGGTFGGATLHADAGEPGRVGEWSHLAVTYDGTSVRLYVNGSEVSSRQTTGSIRQTSDPLWIGGNEPYGEYFEGEIDDVRVYDRALDPAEVRTEMSAPLGDHVVTPTAGLVAAYEFDADSGTRAVDGSPEKNTGSIIGAARAARGRFGNALSFDGPGEMVRVPASASLDLDDAMTLAAWVQPHESEAGWRTILHRQTDAYFLAAGGGGADINLTTLDGLRVAALIGAAVWLCTVLAGARGGWIGGERRSWWPPLALFVAGSVFDSAFAQSTMLVGPTLVAIWLAATATDRVETATMCLLAASFTAVSIGSLSGNGDPTHDDGAIARSAALGVLFVTVGLLGARRAWGGYRRRDGDPRSDGVG
jgi:hypothetical protein